MARGCGCFIPMAMTVFGVGFGLQAAVIWATNPEPTALSCQELASGAAAAEWVTLEGCAVDPRIAVYAPQGRARRAWVALRPSDAGPDGPATVIVDVQEDRALLEVLGAAEVGGVLPDAVAQRVAAPSGVTRTGSALGVRARTMFGQRDVAFAEDLVVVRWGERPSLGSVVAWWVLGLLGTAALTITVLSAVFPTHDTDPEGEEVS